MREENAFGRVVSAYVELMASGEGPTEAQARALNDLADLAHVFLGVWTSLNGQGFVIARSHDWQR